MENNSPTSCPFFQSSQLSHKDLQAFQKAASGGGRKRVFLGLLAASCLIACAALLAFLILPWLLPSSVWLGPFSITLGALGIALLSWIGLTLVWHIYTGKNLPGIRGARHMCIRMFLPLMEIAGRMAGMDKSAVRRSFIKVNNEFVCANRRSIKPSELLLLLPHCLQSSKCPHRLGMELEHCAGCGVCQICAMRALADRYGIRVAIATGGTIARRIVAELHPKQIIAVACERDLVSGIQDCYPIPVFGALNQRPMGPCRDTTASMPVLEQAVALFLRNGETK